MLFNRLERGVLMDPVSAIAGGVGLVGNVVGGVLGSSAADKAAKIQAANAQSVAAQTEKTVESGQQGVSAATGEAVNRVNVGTETANQTLQDYLSKITGGFQPYADLGAQGAQQLSAATGPGGSLTQQFSFNPNDVTSSPEYQFNLQQGLEALARSQSVTGALGSGGAAKAAEQYGQGLAANSYQQAYGNALTNYNTNRNSTLQNLQALLGQGQYGTTGQTNALTNTGNQVANNQLQQGYYSANTPLQSAMYNANLGVQGAQITGAALTGGANSQAAGTIGSANAWQNALGGITNTAQYLSLLKALQPGGTNGAGGSSAARLFNPGSITPNAPNVGPSGGPPLFPNFSLPPVSTP